MTVVRGNFPPACIQHETVRGALPSAPPVCVTPYSFVETHYITGHPLFLLGVGVRFHPVAHLTGTQRGAIRVIKEAHALSESGLTNTDISSGYVLQVELV